MIGSLPWQTIGGLRLRETRYAPGRLQSAHRHQDSTLSLVLGGTLEETSSTATYCAAAGSLVVKPAGYRHADTYGPRGAWLVQVQCANGHGLLASRLGYGWFDSTRLARSLILLLEHGGSRASAAESAEFAFWESIECLAGLLDEPRDRGPTPSGWWPDAVDLLKSCTRQSLSVGAIARCVGVHPVHLARVCRRRFGCTVRAYIRQQRVLSAWRALEQGHQSLANVALQTGFADQAHMTRAFVAVLGTSPGRLRRLTVSDVSV